MKPRILFVDDEPDVLTGLRRALYHRQMDWDLEFVASGTAALARLEAAAFDVIVSDIRMPGMDGSALLLAVQQQYPGIARIALSGETSREAAIRAVGAVHQFLAKPCGPAALEHMLNEALALRGLIRDPRLRALISRVGTLPSVPAIYHQLTRELESDKATTQSIGEIVARDPGLTARVLHITNSAFFGLAQPVTTPQDAVMYIGVDVLRMLVLTDQAFARLAADPVPGLSAARVMEHSFSVAGAARSLARHEGVSRRERDATFSVGLLHDLGKLILAEACPDIYQACLERAARERVALHEIEPALLDATHAGVAGYLFALWGLPPTVFEGVAWHHSIAEELTTGAADPAELSESQRVALRVHIADLAAHLHEPGAGGVLAEAAFARLSRTALGPRLAEWRGALADSRASESAA